MAMVDVSSDFQRARRAYLAARIVRGVTRGRSRPCALEGVAALAHPSRVLRLALNAFAGSLPGGGTIRPCRTCPSCTGWRRISAWPRFLSAIDRRGHG
jgi:hypothetical protein